MIRQKAVQRERGTSPLMRVATREKGVGRRIPKEGGKGGILLPAAQGSGDRRGCGSQMPARRRFAATSAGMGLSQTSSLGQFRETMAWRPRAARTSSSG